MIRCAIVRGLAVTLLVAVPLLCLFPPASATEKAPSGLDRGFRDLYDLNFVEAQQEFGEWQRQFPSDPIGPASEAAAVLFSEFERLGVLEAQFYETDAAFSARKKLSPDPVARGRFNAALQRAESVARTRLANNPKDRDALFAMTLISGLKADYAALIEKRNLASLHLTKSARNWAQQVLAVDPQCYDAHLASGISSYIIGTLSAPVRWILRIGGTSGDKQAGIAELQLTAQRGRYLGPYARILLAIAYVREKDKPRAVELLASLHQEFPHNPLFPREMARLGWSGGS
jgi:hypothetical protein